MRLEFKDTYVEKLCIDNDYAKKYLPADIAYKLRILMVVLCGCDDLSFFMHNENKKYCLEKLKGKLSNRMSLRIKSGSGYRMIIECINTDIKDDYKNMNIIRVIEIHNHEY